MAVQWPDEHKDRFMIRHNSAEVHGVSGYAFASVSDVASLVASNAYQDSIGEKSDPFMIWRLSDIGPVPATISARFHPVPDSPMVEVIITWRELIGGAKYGHVSESGYYRAVEV